MSEEPTKVVRTVATVSVHPAAGSPERLQEMSDHCGRTGETLREIAACAESAKDWLSRIDVSQPPLANDTMVSLALAKIDKIIGMANAAGKANAVIMGSMEGKKNV